MDETANPDAVSFVESGLTFGPFPSTRTWRIEQSQLYCKQAPKGLRMVEAVLWRPGQKGAPPRLIFLEAKSSAPRVATTDHTSPAEQEKRVREFDTEICEKFLCSFHLWLSAAHGRWGSADLPSDLRLDALDLAGLRLEFCLIVRRLPDAEAAEQLSARLSPHFHRLAGALKIDPPAVSVLTVDVAVRRRLCSPLASPTP
jgi:hypothetical protein